MGREEGLPNKAQASTSASVLGKTMSWMESCCRTSSSLRRSLPLHGDFLLVMTEEQKNDLPEKQPRPKRPVPNKKNSRLQLNPL